MSKMFKTITRTWPIFTGCLHGCSYCNVNALATGRLKNHPRYKDWPKPHFNPEVLGQKFKPGEFIFVAYMGDIAFCSPVDFQTILARIAEFPETDFLLMSKNPKWFGGWRQSYTPNVVLGTTLETNRDYRFSTAPTPAMRTFHLERTRHPRKMVSIEPVMDFELEALVGMVERIRPEIIEVGADNYHHHLPEPPAWKLQHLFRFLFDMCPRVIQKEGLERLLKRG